MRLPSSLPSFLLFFFLVACSSSVDDASPTGSGGEGGRLGSGGAVTATGGASETGGAASGGMSAGGEGSGGTGTGGTAPEFDPCEDGQWTCVRTEPSGPYGTKTLDVPAAQNWVNTGLYLKAGDSVSLEVLGGTWSISDSEGDSIDHGPCTVGQMVARIGLHYKDSELVCVEPSATFEADKDGILYVGALAGNDLGETYETRMNATGARQIQIDSAHQTVPTVLADEAASYDFAAVSSGWVELYGEHVILTLPAATAEADKAVLATALATLDEIYAWEEELRSAVPHHGQRLRFFPDGTNPGLMLAGNPIRMQTSLVTDTDRISRSGQEGVGLWGYAHEMGHDFSFVGRMWTYQDKTLESWCNLFTIYALENMGVALNGSTTDCTSESTGNYDSWDAWGGLCFLRQFQFDYGWQFYKDFFLELNKHENNQGISGWNAVHDTFESIAGQDVTPVFEAWNVPNPG